MSDSYEKHKLVLVDFCFGSLFFWTCDNLRIFSLGKCFYATVGSGAYSECILCTLDQSRIFYTLPIVMTFIANRNLKLSTLSQFSCHHDKKLFYLP